MIPVTLLISGMNGSGKTYYANQIAEALKVCGVQVHKASFAGILKDIYKAYKNNVTHIEGKKLLGRISLEDSVVYIDRAICDLLFFGNAPTDRVALQKIGTLIREANEFAFPKYLFDHVPEGTQVVIVDDTRYANEVKYANMVSVHCLSHRIMIPNEVRIARAKARDGFYDYEKDKHSSEQVDSMKGKFNVVPDDSFVWYSVAAVLSSLCFLRLQSII